MVRQGVSYVINILWEQLFTLKNVFLGKNGTFTCVLDVVIYEKVEQTSLSQIIQKI